MNSVAVFMNAFDKRDVTITHLRLMDGGGFLRLTHGPSGLEVHDNLGPDDPVRAVMERLLRELASKVATDASK
jgi:hypothetical protein